MNVYIFLKSGIMKPVYYLYLYGWSIAFGLIAYFCPLWFTVLFSAISHVIISYLYLRGMAELKTTFILSSIIFMCFTISFVLNVIK